MENNQLKLGDRVCVSIPYSPWKHEGIVVKEANPALLQEALIRTVYKNEVEPITQTLTQFLAGREIKKIKKPNKITGYQAAQNAINCKKHNYNLLLNNCENFCNRAQGYTAFSKQVLGTALILGAVIYAITTKKSPFKA